MKPLFWISSSRKDLSSFPDEVQDEIGFSLYVAQKGDKSDNAKPLRGFGGAGVLEVIANFDGDTYRAVYTVRFEEAMYVLHCFKKKSKQGVETPKQDLDLIKSRLRAAEEEYKEWKKRD